MAIIVCIVEDCLENIRGALKRKIFFLHITAAIRMFSIAGHVYMVKINLFSSNQFYVMFKESFQKY